MHVKRLGILKINLICKGNWFKSKNCTHTCILFQMCHILTSLTMLASCWWEWMTVSPIWQLTKCANYTTTVNLWTMSFAFQKVTFFEHISKRWPTSNRSWYMTNSLRRIIFNMFNCVSYVHLHCRSKFQYCILCGWWSSFNCFWGRSQEKWKENLWKGKFWQFLPEHEYFLNP